MKKSHLIQSAFETGLIAPSILSADFSCLASEIKEVEKEGIRWIHVDVMDGHFVPNLTIGPVVVESLRSHSKSIFDCHLMVSEPGKWIGDFAKAGADCITVHVETSTNVRGLLKKIKSMKCMAGISIKPSTPVSAISKILDEVNLVLVMSVEPGFGGQKFMPQALKKIQELVNLRGDRKYLIEVDGGIHAENISSVRSAGADVMVAGSAVFGAKNRKKSIDELKKALDQAN